MSEGQDGRKSFRDSPASFWLFIVGVMVAGWLLMWLGDKDRRPTDSEEREIRKYINDAPERQKERESKRFWDSVNK